MIPFLFHLVEQNFYSLPILSASDLFLSASHSFPSACAVKNKLHTLIRVRVEVLVRQMKQGGDHCPWPYQWITWTQLSLSSDWQSRLHFATCLLRHFPSCYQTVRGNRIRTSRCQDGGTSKGPPTSPHQRQRTPQLRRRGEHQVGSVFEASLDQKIIALLPQVIRAAFIIHEQACNLMRGFGWPSLPVTVVMTTG